MRPRLALVRPAVPTRADVVREIQQHAEQIVDWLAVLVEGWSDPTASDDELTGFSMTAVAELEATVAALRSDLRSGAR